VKCLEVKITAPRNARLEEKIWGKRRMEVFLREARALKSL
jgi:hypothetical protein